MRKGNAPILLEDTWSDVLRKAQRGLHLTAEELATRSGLPIERVRSLLAGEPAPGGAGELAGLPPLSTALGLSADRLQALALNEYHPGNIALPKGMAMFTTPWHDFQVHSYLLWDSRLADKEVAASAVAFDTGSDVSGMMEFARDHHLTIDQILLTHGHGDHVFDLERLIEKTGAAAWIGEKSDEIHGAGAFEAGKEFSVGSLRIGTRSTWGHVTGGITYVIQGLSAPVAMVGDALFAGSMGGPNVSYAACLETNRNEIFSLPPETILCPGHGPLSTVALERANNPFFP